MAIRLTEKQLEELEEVFMMYDKEKEGCVKTRYIGDVIRTLGQNPTDNELQDVINEVDPHATGYIGFSQFLTIIVAKSRDIDIEEEIKDTFRYISTSHGNLDNGFITVEELRESMEQLGEKLTEDEMEEMLSDVKLNDKKGINFEEFAKMILDEYPSHQ